MKVVLSVLGKFHTFDLAREMHSREALTRIFTTYPRFKLRDEGIPSNKIQTFPWYHTPYMAMRLRDHVNLKLVYIWEYLDRITFDRHTARNLPECDIFVGISSAALASGQHAKSMGARYVCDRGSAHIRTQDDLLRDEYAHWNEPYTPTDPRIVEREEAEYTEADCITVPSSFSARTFAQQGVDTNKVKVLGYGVNLQHFYPSVDRQAGTFNVLFAGGAHLRKGIPYLLQAYRALKHPRKTLSFAGTCPPDLIHLMKRANLWPEDVRLLGHLNRDQLRDCMSRSHALVLPSIEDGFGLVLAQALACGCPVIASEHTGAPDLIEDGQAGFIVPIRRGDLIAERLQRLADEPALQQRLRLGALDTVRNIGGWQAYGDQAMAIYQGLLT